MKCPICEKELNTALERTRVVSFDRPQYMGIICHYDCVRDLGDKFEGFVYKHFDRFMSQYTESQKK